MWRPNDMGAAREAFGNAGKRDLTLLADDAAVAGNPAEEALQIRARIEDRLVVDSPARLVHQRSRTDDFDVEPELSGEGRLRPQALGLLRHRVVVCIDCRVMEARHTAK